MTMKPEPPQNSFPVLLTGEDIARIMQISRAYAYRLMQDPDLPVIRIGKVVRVKPADLEKFLREHTTRES